MGYTHYWTVRPDRVTPEQFLRLAMDCRRLFDAAISSGIELSGWSGDPVTRPELSEGSIVFNGRQPDDYETFVLDVTPLVDPGPDAPDYERFRYERNLSIGGRWECCKTARRPYDAVVAAVLIRAAELLQEAITVTSDGNFDDPFDENYSTWARARSLYEAVFGGTAPDPMHQEQPA